tara:strand:+ start:906 stop:1160 length:255 start_codon:yes stop_codon:yes gene_type:complete
MPEGLGFAGAADWSNSNIIITPSGDVLTTDGNLIEGQGGQTGQGATGRSVVLTTPQLQVIDNGKKPNYMLFIFGALALSQLGIL